MRERAPEQFPIAKYLPYRRFQKLQVGRHTLLNEVAPSERAGELA
jgi:hypothetical protein